MDTTEPANIGTHFVPALRKKYNVSKSTAKELVKEMSLPNVGDEFRLGNFLYKVVYTRTDPYRFTAEPVAIKEITPESESLWQKIKKTISTNSKKK